MNKFLLDFDGVIFKNTYVQDYVTKMSVDYIKTRSNITLNEAISINRKAYKKYGHTSLLYGDKSTLTHAYNYHVFSKNKKDLVTLISKAVNRKNKSHLRKMLELKRSLNHEYVLCTNTPKWYCEIVLNNLGSSCEELFGDNISFTSDTGLLKPSSKYFDLIEDQLKDNHFVFLDDSILNIQNIQYRPNWTGLIIENEKDVLDILNVQVRLNQ